jgi:hypothetical protein
MSITYIKVLMVGARPVMVGAWLTSVEKLNQWKRVEPSGKVKPEEK